MYDRRPNGPDYLIIDNFAEFFELDKAELLGARKEAEKISKKVCYNVQDLGTARCDTLLFLKGLESVVGMFTIDQTM